MTPVCVMFERQRALFRHYTLSEFLMPVCHLLPSNVHRVVWLGLYVKLKVPEVLPLRHPNTRLRVEELQDLQIDISRSTSWRQ